MCRSQYVIEKCWRTRCAQTTKGLAGLLNIQFGAGVAKYEVIGLALEEILRAWPGSKQSYDMPFNLLLPFGGRLLRRPPALDPGPPALEP